MYPCKTPCGDIDCLNSCIHSKKGIDKMRNPYTWFYWLAGIVVYTQVMIWLLRAIRQAL
jgi:hypothetical protein